MGGNGQHDVELEVSRLSCDGDGCVISDDLGANHHGGFGDDGVDLSGHDARAGLKGGKDDLCKTCKRAAVHPTQIVGDLHDADGEGAELSAEFDGGVLGAEAFKKVGAWNKSNACVFGEFGGKAFAEFRVCVDARPDGGSTLSEFQDAGEGRGDALDAVADL